MLCSMKDYNAADTDETLTNTVDAAQGDRIAVSYDSVHSDSRQTFEGEVIDVTEGLLTVDLGDDLRFVDTDGEVSVVTDAAVVRRIGGEASVTVEVAAVAASEAAAEVVMTDGGEVVDDAVPVAEGDVEVVDEALLDAVLTVPGVLRAVVRDSGDESPLVAVLVETSTLFGDARLSQPVGERVRSSVFALSRGADARLDVEGVRTDARGAIVEFRVREDVSTDGGSRPDLGRLSATVEAVRAQLTEDRHATDGHLGTLGYVSGALGGERRD